MTAKILRNKGQIDCTRGVSREQRAINRRNKLESLLLSSGGNSKQCMSHTQRHRRDRWRITYDNQVAKANFEKRLLEIDEENFGEVLCDREVSAFEEIPFGDIVNPQQRNYRTTDDVLDLSSIVVSLALFDGDKMLFVCSGIPLPCGTTRVHLTRFVTSAHLVRAFMDYRNRDDNLRVSVRLPDNTITDGFLGLYDDDIAIVTCLGLLDVQPIDVNFEETCTSDERLLAAGRAYKSGSLMATHGYLYNEFSKTWVPESRSMSKAVLGGPVLGEDGRFIGMPIDIYERCDGMVRYPFLPLGVLCDRLKHFQILNPEKLDFRGYLLPKGVHSIVPSGFMKVFYRIRAFGYPIPPPLVLEFNGDLINGFEERFGQVIAWKGYPYGSPSTGSRARVWHLLKKKVVRDISRRVVSLASFKGKVRSFACTGLFIKLKWHGSKAACTVILTSASLVRSHGDDKIDKTLKIDVFLPPNQRGCGTLEFYNLNYNIAIVSVKNFNAVRAQDIFCSLVQKPSEVVAIGRDTLHGPLMASLGEVKLSNKDSKLDCEDLKFSTCKITKAGIGGPLVNFDGRFVGMNFYDGSGLTPFLPGQKIVEVLLSLVSDLTLEWGYGHGNSLPIPDHPGTKKNRWPVPEPYWYHGELDVDRFHVPELRGRTLN